MNIKITKLTSIAPSESSTHYQDQANTFQLQAGQTISNLEELSLPLLGSTNEINTSNIRMYTVDGLDYTFAIAAVEGVGLISALGTDPSDFAPEDPELVKITLPTIAPGQSLNCTVMVNQLSTGETVSWILGDVEGDL